MTVDQLTLKENELYSIVMDLSHKGQSKETDEQLEVVYDLYKKVHKYYADMADKDDEALKRGLFIQWYAITEPGYLTGINSLDELAETKIIKPAPNSKQFPMARDVGKEIKLISLQ